MGDSAGAVWLDVIHFTQILGNGAAVQLYNKIVPGVDQAFFDSEVALAADAKRHIIGDLWRCRWVIAGITPDFMFDCEIYPG